MDRLLETGAVDDRMIRSVAARLSAFHANAKTSKLRATGSARSVSRRLRGAQSKVARVAEATVSRLRIRKMEGPVGFEPTTPGLKASPAELPGSQSRLATRSADFDLPTYMIFRQVR